MQRRARTGLSGTHRTTAIGAGTVVNLKFGRQMYNVGLRRGVPLSLLFTAFQCFCQPPAEIVVVSAADYRSYIAPDSQAAIFGSGLADSAASGQVDATGQFTTQLAGTSVQVCGQYAGLIFVGPSQINFITPSNLPPAICPVIVTANGRTLTGTADVRLVSPTFFTKDGTGAGRASALNGVTQQAAPFFVFTPENNGSDKGTRLTVFGTGFRNANSASNSGVAPYALVTTPAGKQWPASIEYLGPAPGLPGVDQVNIAVPAVINDAGVVSFTLTVGSVRSNAVILDIANENAPVIESITPASASAGAVVTVTGRNLGTREMVSAGRVAALLTEPSGTRVSLVPEFVDSSRIQFTLPSIRMDASTFYYGPLNVCLQVDSAAACSSTVTSTAPAPSGAAPGQTFLSATRTSLQNGVSRLSQLGATEAAQAVSTNMPDMLAQYTDIVNSAAAGNPKTISFQRQDGTVVSAVADSNLISRLDALAALFQTKVTAGGGPEAMPPGTDGLRPDCMNAQEESLQSARDAYRSSVTAVQATMQSAALIPTELALANCLNSNTDGCVANVGSSLASDEIAASLLTGLLTSPILTSIAVATGPSFLDSIQIMPSTADGSMQRVNSGTAVLIPLGQSIDLSVKGHFVSASPPDGANNVVMRAVSGAITSVFAPPAGNVTRPACDVCQRIAQLCPQCGDAVSTVAKNVADDIAGAILKNLGALLPASLPAQNQNDIPLTAASMRVDEGANSDVTITAACATSSTSLTGVHTTGGAYEAFEFVVDPGVLLLTSEVTASAAPGSVFSMLNAGVGPAAPPLSLRTDKTAYTNQEQARLVGTGFPPYSAVAISLSSSALAAKDEVTAFADGAGVFAISTPLYDAQRSGAYTLTASIKNSSIRATAALTISAGRLPVQIVPKAGSWTSSPQSILVNAPGAQRIYYSANQAVGGTAAAPAAPSPANHDGVITGPSGTVQLSGTDGQFVGWTYVFVAEDAAGLGSASAPAVYSIDLSHGAAAAQITSITTTPAAPLDGQLFTFSIAGLNFDPATAQVTFNGPGCPAGCTIGSSNLTRATAAQLSGSAKLSGGLFRVSVQNGSGTASNAFPLNVSFATPRILGISTSPALPVAGQEFAFTIVGSSFDPNSAVVIFTGPGCTDSTQTRVGIPAAALSSRSSTQLSGSVTLADGCYTVTVLNSARSTPSNTTQFTVSGARLTAITTDPVSPLPGQAFSFTITGANFDPNSAMVIFSGAGCSQVPNICTIPSSALLDASATQLSGMAILGSGVFTVTVQNGAVGVASNGLPLGVGAPLLSSLTTTPNQAIAGQSFQFTIKGTGFDPNSAMVNFTGPSTPTGLTLSTGNTGTELSGTVTLASAGSYAITVQNGSSGTPSNSRNLTVSNAPASAPQLTRITTTPAAPMAGQAFSFIIDGAGIDPASAVVNFSGPSTPTNVSLASSSTATQLQGTVTLTAAGTYSVTVQNGSTGTPSNALTLTVQAAVPGAPQLTNISTTPNPPVSGQAFTFTISGAGFDPQTAAVNFTGPGCAAGMCLVANSALLTKTATQLSGTATLIGDSFAVTVQNGPAGTSSNALTLKMAVSSSGGPQLSVISTTPNLPVAGQAFTFTISGAGFDPNGATIFFNGPGCGPATTCVVGPSALSSASSTQLVGSAVLAAGNFSVSVLNGGMGNLSNRLNLVVAEAILPVQVTGISPNSTSPGLPFTFTITGSGFDPATAVVLFYGGQQCTTPACSVENRALTNKSATSLTGIGPALSEGTYLVAVQNLSGGPPSNAVQLTVSSSVSTAPQITAVSTLPSPPVDQQAFTLTVTGSGFDPATAIISIAGPGCSTTPCTIANGSLTAKTSTQLSGPITLSAGTFSVVVQNGSGETASNSVSLSVSPQVNAIAPFSAIAGQAFTFVISGSGFDPSSAVVTFTGPNCSPCSVANAALSGKTSAALSGIATLTGAGIYLVAVQNGVDGAPSTSVIFTVSAGGTGPTLSAVATTPTPVAAQQSFTFTITGTGFDPATAMVLFSGPGCTPCTVANASLTSKSANQLAASQVLPLSGAYSVTVQNGSTGAPSNAAVVTVPAASGAPQITSITPTSVIAGQAFTFTIVGSGFDPNTVVVNFAGGTYSNLSLATKSATQLTGSVTLTAAASYTVTVQNGSSGTASNGVTVTAATSSSGPQISSITPNSVVLGQQLAFTIAGSGFDPSTVIVNFSGGGVSNLSLSNKTTTQLVGTVNLTSAGSYAVTVQNGSSGTASNSATVTVLAAGTPQITSMSPTSAVAGQSFSFTINGTGFDPATVMVNFSGGSVSNLSLSKKTATQLTGSVTLTAGTYAVSVNNGSGGTASNSVTLTVSTAGTPQISSIDPTTAVAGQAFTFTITGLDFDPDTVLVSFTGGTFADLVLSSKNATQLTGSVTLSSAATYTVTVQNGATGTPSNPKTIMVSGSAGGGGPQLSKIILPTGNPVHGEAGGMYLWGSGFDDTVQIVFSGPGCTPEVCTIAQVNADAINPDHTAVLVIWTPPAAGSFTVQVRNGPGGALSNGLSLTVQ